MKFLGMLFGLGAVVVAVAAEASHGAAAPEVWTRKYVMKMIGEQAAVLEAMVTGHKSFDDDVARMAAAEIAQLARDLPGLFEVGRPDPFSEARPEIWEDFDTFAAQTELLADLADAASSGIGTIEELRLAYQGINETCRSCHQAYRD